MANKVTGRKMKRITPVPKIKTGETKVYRSKIPVAFLDGARSTEVCKGTIGLAEELTQGDEIEEGVRLSRNSSSMES